VSAPDFSKGFECGDAAAATQGSDTGHAASHKVTCHALEWLDPASWTACVRGATGRFLDSRLELALHNSMLFAAAALITLAAASAPSATRANAEKPMSETVIGPSNPLLADGATALEAGHADEGVRLTLEGLKVPTPVRDMAAAHANLCAGYVLLHRLDEALIHCNTAIELDERNWRAYNNRAAVLDARGLYDQAIADVEKGLKISPDSAILQKSLKIIYSNKHAAHTHSKRASDA